MADFEERKLKISFDELNTKLNNCIQKILSASFMESKDSLNDFEICLQEYSTFRKDFQTQCFCYDENLCGHFDREAAENVHLRKLAFDIIKELRIKYFLELQKLEVQQMSIAASNEYAQKVYEAYSFEAVCKELGLKSIQY